MPRNERGVFLELYKQEIRDENDAIKHNSPRRSRK
jgi:hypothetical protein